MFAPGLGSRSLLVVAVHGLLAIPGLAAQEPPDSAVARGVTAVTVLELQAAARQGMGLLDLLRRDAPEVRFRQFPTAANPTGTCIEFGPPPDQPGCRSLDLVVDGVVAPDSFELLRALDPARVRRLEVLAPGAALARYGNFGDRGVILIETFTELLPDLAESTSYPWTRVLASAFVTNVLAVGLTYLPVAYCTHVWDGSLQLRDLDDSEGQPPVRCPGAVAVSAGALALGAPGAASGLVARRVGTTAESRGTLVSITPGTLTHLTGHLLFFQGRANDSSVMSAVGAGILLLGTPLAVTLTDRFSRTLR